MASCTGIVRTRRSTKYRKYRRPKTGPFRSRTYDGKDTIIGHVPALRDIEAKLGRRLNIVKTAHTRSEWVFMEPKGPKHG